jgi:catechol-2,3-dioxygenase
MRKTARRTSTTRKDIDTRYKRCRARAAFRMHLYETHLPVADTKIAERFYREIVGLPFAYRDSTRDIIFLWADAKKKLWSGCGDRTLFTEVTTA